MEINDKSALSPELQALGAVPQKTKTAEDAAQVDKQEFLQLLVTQLENQDPLDPQNQEEFAVQLAQFSQLEQLVNINETLQSGGTGGGLSSLASYLGHEVWLNSETLAVNGGEAGSLRFSLPADATDVAIELLGVDGEIQEVLTTGPLQSGTHSIDLTGIKSADGEYGFKVTVNDAAGTRELQASSGGVVNGFVPGPEPVLLVQGRQVDLSEITEVRLSEVI